MRYTYIFINIHTGALYIHYENSVFDSFFFNKLPQKTWLSCFKFNLAELSLSNQTRHQQNLIKFELRTMIYFTGYKYSIKFVKTKMIKRGSPSNFILLLSSKFVNQTMYINNIQTLYTIPVLFLSLPPPPPPSNC